MENALRYLRDYELWIYLILGVVALWQVRKFILGWEELRGAAFGLEREKAQAKINQAATMFTLFLMLAVGEFVLVSFVAPTVPGAIPLLTPTLNLLATPSITLPPPTPGTPAAPLDATPQPSPAAASGSGCIPGQIEITSPKNGDTVSGVVAVRGTANIPSFGFYKYEVAHPGDTAWLSVNAGQSVVNDGALGDWATTMLPPGDYLLRLVVTDNQGNALPPCMIQVRVVAATPQ